MWVGGEVMRRWGGTRFIYPLDTRYVHARNTQEESWGALETRSARVQHAHICCMFAGHAV